MNKQELEPEKYNPDENLRVFATKGLLGWLVVALLLHILLIGGTSVGYVYDLVYDVEEEETPGETTDGETGEDGDEEAEGETDGDDNAGEEGETEQADPETAKADEDKPDSEKTHDELMEERADSEVVKQTQEVAKPEDIPENPEDAADDIPIDIDQTNR